MRVDGVESFAGLQLTDEDAIPEAKMQRKLCNIGGSNDEASHQREVSFTGTVSRASDPSPNMPHFLCPTQRLQRLPLLMGVMHRCRCDSTLRKGKR